MTTTPQWRKAKASGDNGGQCVELADLGDSIGVRDSKHPDAGHLTITRHQLAELLDAARDGQFDGFQ